MTGPSRARLDRRRATLMGRLDIRPGLLVSCPWDPALRSLLLLLGERSGTCICGITQLVFATVGVCATGWRVYS
jgi:hypothetical protein